MSAEFIRGPNVYLRETIATDLDNIKDSLADWDWFPLSTDQTKTILKGALIQMRNIERPYKDTSRFFESFTICKYSDNSFVGFTQYRVTPGKEVVISYNAGLPAVRGTGLLNEASLIRDAAIFSELECTFYTNKLDPQFTSSLRDYQTLEGTEVSSRSNRTLKLVKVTKSGYDTWRAANASSVPSYTFSGGSYTPPQDR